MARRYAQGGLATPPPDLDDEPEEEPAEPASTDDDEGDQDPDDSDEGDEEEEPADDAAAGSSSRSLPAAPAVVNSGAGWLLGLLLWGWVILPFVKGGPKQVGATLRAKFLNQAPDGSPLP